MAQQSVGPKKLKIILPPPTEEGIVLPKKVMMKIKKPKKTITSGDVFAGKFVVKKKSTQNQ